VRRKVYANYNASLDVRAEFPGSLGDEYHFKIQIEKFITTLQHAIWLSLILNGGPINELLNNLLGLNIPSTTYPAARTFISALGWFGVFDTNRWLLEVERATYILAVFFFLSFYVLRGFVFNIYIYHLHHFETCVNIPIILLTVCHVFYAIIIFSMVSRTWTIHSGSPLCM
jgi:hypothetical protein